MTSDQLTKIGDEKKCPVAIIVRNGALLLGMRNYTPDKWKAISVWTTPGGRCDAGETLEQTLRREVKEEVGITDLQIHDFIGEIPGAKEGDTVPMYYCTTSQEVTLMEPEKFSEWRWVPIDQYLAGGPFAEMNPTAHAMISNYLRSRL